MRRAHRKIGDLSYVDPPTLHLAAVPPTAFPVRASEWLPIIDRADLHVGSLVRDCGGTFGYVSALHPRTEWADGSTADRIEVKWGTSHHRSNPRFAELVTRTNSILGDGICVDGNDHAPKVGEPWWILNGERHCVASCGSCGLLFQPGVGRTPLAVPVNANDSAMCFVCMFRHMGVAAMPGVTVDFAPADYAERYCHCPPCLGVAEAVLTESHS